MHREFVIFDNILKPMHGPVDVRLMHRRNTTQRHSAIQTIDPLDPMDLTVGLPTTAIPLAPLWKTLKQSGN